MQNYVIARAFMMNLFRLIMPRKQHSWLQLR
jgi:hypothetical protein